MYKHENEKALIIIDSVKEYFGNPRHMHYKRSLANYARQIGKNCLSNVADMGAYYYKSKSSDLIDYESSLPIKFDVPMKGFCLYHKKDFDRLSDEQKENLMEHHGKALKIIEVQ